MEKWIEEFLDHIRDRKEYSENTIAAYRIDLTQLREYLAEKGLVTWRRLGKQEILGFGNWLQDRDKQYASSTVARKIASVRSFCHYLASSGLLDQDPTEGLGSPTVQRTAPDTLDDREMAMLIELPSRSQTSKGQRDRAILELLYSTGMRVSELTALNLPDLDLNAGTVRCGVRAATERVVPLGRAAREAVETYIGHSREELLESSREKALFVNHRGERLSRQGLWLIIKQYANQLDIDVNITPHTLRHSAAAHKLRRGANLTEVQHLLGHASSNSTQVYARLARSAARKADDLPHESA